MAMQWLERELRGTHDPCDRERADLIAAMRKARGSDIPFPDQKSNPYMTGTFDERIRRFHEDLFSDPQYQAEMQAEIDAEKQKEEKRANMIQDYKIKPHTQELITATWSTFWEPWAKSFKADGITIPDCDRTTGEIEELEKQGRLVLYLPEEVYRWRTGYLLETRKMPSGKERNETEDFVSKLIDSQTFHGWLDIDASITTPYVNTTEDELRHILESMGRHGATVNPYVIASMFTQEIKGFYFEEPSGSCRLLETTYADQPLVVSFKKDGPFWFDCRDPKERSPRLGGRSIGIKS